MMKEFLQKAAHLYCRALTLVLAVLLALLVSVVLYQLLSRNTNALPLVIWTEEVSRFLFVWMLFCGAAVAVRERTHFKVDVLPEVLPVSLQRGMGALTLTVMMTIGLVMVLGGGYLTGIGQVRFAPQTGIPMSWVYAAIPFSGISIMAFLAERILTGDTTESAQNSPDNFDERDEEAP